jgi:hypothetical protein
MTRVLGIAAAMLISLISYRSDAAPAASADLVKARQFFFGAENVDSRTGAVDRDKVVFTWLTNSTLGVSMKGRIFLLDSYVNRAETVPGRTPFVVEDLVKLAPEAIFLGHGHFDHADNAAYIAGKLNIPIYASSETCVAMQVDAANLHAADPVGYPVSSVECHGVTTSGSTPAAEIVRIDQFEPLACISAFRHLHSTTPPAAVLQLPDYPIVPVNNITDPRDLTMYPRGTAFSYRSSGSGGPGGPVSILYQFVMRGERRFTFLWHNTSGALKEGCAINQCWGPAVGQAVVDRLKSLPPTDIEFGSLVSLGFATTGMRDPIAYQQALHPKIYIPVHQTDAAALSSSLEFKIAYLKQLDIMDAAHEGLTPRPEPRWMVDPDDFVRPMVYDPKDDRWRKASGIRGSGPCAAAREHDDD